MICGTLVLDSAGTGLSVEIGVRGPAVHIRAGDDTWTAPAADVRLDQLSPRSYRLSFDGDEYLFEPDDPLQARIVFEDELSRAAARKRRRRPQPPRRRGRHPGPAATLPTEPAATVEVVSITPESAETPSPATSPAAGRVAAAAAHEPTSATIGHALPDAPPPGLAGTRPSTVRPTSLAMLALVRRAARTGASSARRVADFLLRFVRLLVRCMRTAGRWLRAAARELARVGSGLRARLAARRKAAAPSACLEDHEWVEATYGTLRVRRCRACASVGLGEPGGSIHPAAS